MEHEAFFSLMMNYGGMGILAAVMIFLHVRSLKDFREERESDRQSRHKTADIFQQALADTVTNSRELLERVFEIGERRHEAVMEKIQELRDGDGCKAPQRSQK